MVIRQFLIMLFSLFLINNSVSAQSDSQLSNPYLEQLPKWASVLERFVDDQGRINFAALLEDRADLDAFVGAIEAVSPAANPELFDSRDQVLAYHANAYNALAMKGVIDRNIPKNFSTFFKRAGFFKFRKVIIGGKTTDLHAYENKVIRPIGEARMHFVLNCMVRDCPRLPRTPFYASSMQADLTKAAVEFFTREKHTRVDNQAKKLHLSGIMKFYTKDYVPSGKKQDLLAYVNQFRQDKVPSDYKVSYIKYDWTINKQP